MNPLAAVIIAGLCGVGFVALVAREYRAGKREAREARDMLAEAFMDNATVEAVRRAIECERRIEEQLEDFRAMAARIAVRQ